MDDLFFVSLTVISFSLQGFQFLTKPARPNI